MAFLKHIRKQRNYLVQTEVRGPPQPQCWKMRQYSSFGGEAEVPPPSQLKSSEKSIWSDAINLITSTGTVRFYSRCLSRSHHVWGDGGDDSAPAQVCGWAAGPRACWEDTPGETVQGQLAQQRSLSVKIRGVDTGVVSPPQLLRCSGVKVHDHSAALLDCNRSKNRSGAVMPGEPSTTKLHAFVSAMLKIQ